MEILIVESERVLHTYLRENTKVLLTSFFKPNLPKMKVCFVVKGFSLCFFSQLFKRKKRRNFLSRNKIKQIKTVKWYKNKAKKFSSLLQGVGKRKRTKYAYSKKLKQPSLKVYFPLISFIW